MKKNCIALAPYAAVLAADFWLLPFLAADTGGAMLLMLCVMPLLAFMTGVVWGVRRGASVWPALAALVLFLPAIFLHFNATAWVYAPAYAVLVLAGTGLGRLFHGKR